MSSNIYRDFKRQLGYVGVTNQYVELSRRVLTEKCLNSDDNTIESLAKENGLKISALPEKLENRISKYYIIQVHSCVEMFVRDFRDLKGSASYKRSLKEDRKSMLHKTMEYVFGNIPNKYQNLFNLCEYYRLVRNSTVHSSLPDDLRNKFEKVRQLVDFETLHAPSDLEHINFDDQVLFSRAAGRLMKVIFNQDSYDWDTILEEFRNEIKGLDRGSRLRRKRQKANELSIYYPFSKEYILERFDQIGID